MIVRVIYVGILLSAILCILAWTQIVDYPPKTSTKRVLEVAPDKFPQLELSPIKMESFELPPPPSLESRGPIMPPSTKSSSKIEKKPRTRIMALVSKETLPNFTRPPDQSKLIIPLKTGKVGLSMSDEVPEIEPIQPGLVLNKAIKPSPNLTVANNKKTSQFPTKPIAGPTVSSGSNLDEGRLLLRALEHGKGPGIEIAWPKSGIDRRKLYRLFKLCYGMETAVMDKKGRLFRKNGKMSTEWMINMDSFSGFVRQSDGDTTFEENQMAYRIKRHHGITDGVTVRLFPRVVDALFLAGIKQLVGDKYDGAGLIRARYKSKGRQVKVSNLILNLRPISGEIDLTRAASRQCPI